MIEIRDNDRTVKWRGDDPLEALAAVFALGESAGQHVLIGIDTGELPALDLPPDPAPPSLADVGEDETVEEALQRYRTAKAQAEAQRAQALSELPAVELISEAPAEVWCVVDVKTGEIVQCHDTEEAAEAAIEAARQRTIDHTAEQGHTESPHQSVEHTEYRVERQGG